MHVDWSCWPLLRSLALPAAARADTVVALGDSAISGEAGRWAGNTNGVVLDAPTRSARPRTTTCPARESIPGCHRSKAAEVHIGGGVTSVNLACSGARTYSRVSDGKFKPGIDFYTSGANKGQALALQELATAHKDIKAVVVLIGANDYGFADIVQTCVTDWLTSPSWWKNYCQDDSNMAAMFSAANITTNTNSRARRVPARQAGDGRRAATPTGPVPDPRPDLLGAAADVGRASATAETGFTRQTIGGCGVWNSDANWARNTVVNTLNSTITQRRRRHGQRPVLDMVEALDGRKLCENTVGLLEEKGVAELAERRARSTRPSGCTRSAR